MVMKRLLFLAALTLVCLASSGVSGLQLHPSPHLPLLYYSDGSIWVEVPQVGGVRGVASRVVWDADGGGEGKENVSFYVPSATPKWARFGGKTFAMEFDISATEDGAAFPVDSAWVWDMFSWVEFCPEHRKLVFHETPLDENSNHECGWGNETVLVPCDNWEACQLAGEFNGYVVYNGTHGGSFREYSGTTDTSIVTTVYLALLFVHVGYWIVEKSHDLNLFSIRAFVGSGCLLATAVSYRMSTGNSLISSHLYANVPVLRGNHHIASIFIHFGAVIASLSTLVVTYLGKRDALYVRVLYEITITAAINLLLIGTNDLTPLNLVLTFFVSLATTITRVRDAVSLYDRAVAIFVTRTRIFSTGDVALLCTSTLAIALSVTLSLLVTWEPIVRLFVPESSWLISICLYSLLVVYCLFKVVDLQLWRLGV